MPNIAPTNSVHIANPLSRPEENHVPSAATESQPTAKLPNSQQMRNPDNA